MYFGEQSKYVPNMIDTSPWFKGLGRKFILDGGLLIRTGALTQPYHDMPDWKGELRDPDIKKRRILQYHSQGVQLAIHNNGDAAIDWTLDVLEEAQRLFPNRKIRHRLEHAQIVREDQLQRMAKLGVMGNFFISHIFYYGDRHRLNFLGPERAAKLNPLQSALNHGVQFAVHNDNPVTPVNPLHNMWVATHRITRDGVPLGQEECLSPNNALRTYTIDAAYQGSEENEKGQLAVGNFADFVVLSDNPLKQTDTDKIKNIKPHLTVQSGHVTYSDGLIPVHPKLMFWANYLKNFSAEHPDFFLS
jgi:hypothetical protein